MWLGLGFGWAVGPCPWACQPPPPPVLGCQEEKLAPVWGCQPPVCWGDACGRDGEPIGGKDGIVPVGVVGLLENPEAPEAKNINGGKLASIKCDKKCQANLWSQTSEASGQVSDVGEWIQVVWLSLVGGRAVD